MKKYFVSIVAAAFFATQLSAFTFYDQLCAFNPNWKTYRTEVPYEEARQFKSDREYVSAHLGSVLIVLRTNPVSQLTAKQYSSRMKLIGILDEYRVSGKFPINYYRQERVPVFIDDQGTHCAVGYLLQRTGREDLALRIAAADNYAWVKDIQDAELLAWQESSGFSLEELKLIQGAYSYYRPNALLLPNRYEVPQKPDCIAIYFENKINGQLYAENKKNIWCRGEGENGVLNGRWEQNCSPGIPWIVGYFEKGKRTGQWEEYYRGTKQLCRTENWRNDKLNGIRKRFNKSGMLIEVILFKEGNAISKTNYSLEDSLVWIRKPIDSSLVYTEVYTFKGALIAMGREKIFNPGNLLWFQNIELTALNSTSITSREISLGNEKYFPGSESLYDGPPLVEYKKVGEWIYYKEYRIGKDKENLVNSSAKQFKSHFPHFGDSLFNSIKLFGALKTNFNYDSIHVLYANNVLQRFSGYGEEGCTYLQIQYLEKTNEFSFIPLLKRNEEHQKATRSEVRSRSAEYYPQLNGIFDREYFDGSALLAGIDNFILPKKRKYAGINLSSL